MPDQNNEQPRSESTHPDASNRTTTPEGRPTDSGGHSQTVEQPDVQQQSQHQSSTADDANPPPAAQDDGTVSVDDLTLDRNPQTGELEPETIDVEEIGAAGETVKAKPMNNAARQKYLRPLQEGDDLDDDVLAELFDTHIIDPDLTQAARCPDSRVTERFISEDLNPRVEDGLFFAVLLASGEQDLVEMLRKVRRGELTEDDLAAGGEGQRGETEGN